MRCAACVHRVHQRFHRSRNAIVVNIQPLNIQPGTRITRQDRAAAVARLHLCDTGDDDALRLSLQQQRRLLLFCLVDFSLCSAFSPRTRSSDCSFRVNLALY